MPLTNYTKACIPTVVYPCDGEEDHWIAARLAPEQYPFTVESVAYGMREETVGSRHCDSTLSHELEVYVMDADAELPPAEADVLFHLVVHPAPMAAPEGEDRELEFTLDEPIVLAEGEHLVVAIQNAGDASGPGCASAGAMTCVSTCSGPDFEPDENFWSNSAAAPYPWATLASFGISNGPNVTAFGHYD